MPQINDSFLADIASGKLEGKLYGFGPIGDEGAKTLSVALQSPNCKLTGLHLGYHNQIGPEGAKALSVALQNPNCKLTGLHLYYSQIGSEGAKALSVALQNPNCKLTELDLSNNHIGSEGAKVLSSALQSPNCKLTTLDLRSNQIGSEGAKALSIALQNPNCKLTELDVWNNEIDDEGAKALSTTLQSPNCKLTKLDVSENQLGTEGVKTLSIALQSPNCKLIELDYFDGRDKKADQIIKDALKQNRALREVPFLGPILLHSGVEISSRVKYAKLLRKEKLDVKEIWRMEDMSSHLKTLGIPIGDVIRLIATFKSLHGLNEAKTSASSAAEKGKSVEPSSSPATVPANSSKTPASISKAELVSVTVQVEKSPDVQPALQKLREELIQSMLLHAGMSQEQAELLKTKLEKVTWDYDNRFKKSDEVANDVIVMMRKLEGENVELKRQLNDQEKKVFEMFRKISELGAAYSALSVQVAKLGGHKTICNALVSTGNKQAESFVLIMLQTFRTKVLTQEMIKSKKFKFEHGRAGLVSDLLVGVAGIVPIPGVGPAASAVREIVTKFEDRTKTKNAAKILGPMTGTIDHQEFALRIVVVILQYSGSFISNRNDSEILEIAEGLCEGIFKFILQNKKEDVFCAEDVAFALLQEGSGLLPKKATWQAGIVAFDANGNLIKEKARVDHTVRPVQWLSEVLMTYSNNPEVVRALLNN